jgi:hypothetical protein
MPGAHIGGLYPMGRGIYPPSYIPYPYIRGHISGGIYLYAYAYIPIPISLSLILYPMHICMGICIFYPPSISPRSLEKIFSDGGFFSRSFWVGVGRIGLGGLNPPGSIGMQKW